MPNPPIDLTEDEQEEIANILIAVHKTRLFAQWNEEEKIDSALNNEFPFSLSTDFFQKPPVAEIQFPPKAEKEKPKYLFDQKAFKNWKRSLESRERIMTANHKGILNAISDTEDAFLIPTRDAIIKHIAADEGKSIEETKDFITRNLLIDADMQCCSSTTRATQAIEALQVLLWGIHNQILLDEPSIEQLSLEAPDFEEEWKWIGSYATWRAAMFVQLYPENIMLPELRQLNDEGQFHDTLKLYRNSKNKSDIDYGYTNYFKEIEEIKNIELVGNIDKINPRTYEKGLNVNENYVHCFGKNPHSGNYYFKILQLSNDEEMQLLKSQSRWKKLPDEIKGEFVGLSEWSFDSNYHLHFYFKGEKDDESKLFLAIYEYKKDRWKNKVEIEFEARDGNIQQKYSDYYIDMNHRNKAPRIVRYGYDLEWDSIGQNKRRSNITVNAFFLGKDLKARENMFQKGVSFDRSGIELKYVYSDDNLVVDYYNLVTGNVHYGASISGLAIVFYESHKYFINYFTWDKDIQVLSKSLYGYGRGAYGLKGIPFLFQKNLNEPIENALIRKDSKRLYYQDLIPIRPSLGLNSDEGSIAPNFFNIKSRAAENDPIILIRKSTDKITLKKYSLESRKLKLNKKVDFNSIPLNDEFLLINGKVEIDIEKVRLLNLSLLNINNSNESLIINKYSNVIDDAFYYLPLAAASKLVSLKEFDEAQKYLSIIYDFKENEPIYYAFRNPTADLLKINNNWGDNPLNPHDIAAARPGTLKRSFYIQLINYFLAYANHEFTQDTVESIARARQLYLEARDLIKVLKGDETDCNTQIAEFEITINSTYIKEYWERIKTYLYGIDTTHSVETLLADITTTWEGAGTELEKMQQIETDVLAAVNSETSNSMDTELVEMEQRLVTASNLIVAPKRNAKESNNNILTAGNNFSSAVLQTTGFTESSISTQAINMPFLEVRNAPMPIQAGRESFFEEVLTKDVVNQNVEDSYATEAQLRPEKILKLSFQKKSFGALSPFKFCVAPNPIIRAYELQVQLNLYKIRNCMNISGIQRSLDPFAAPTDSTSGVPMIGVDGLISSGGIPIPQASPYRFGFLIDRSKELINVGQQIENAFLSALEKLDDENYSVLRAKQDLQTAKANVKLQDLRINEAEGGIKLAELQTDRAEIQVSGLQEMIDAGLNEYEQTMIQNYYTISALNAVIFELNKSMDLASITGSVILGTASNAPAKFVELGIKSAIYEVLQGVQGVKDNLQTNIYVDQILAAQSRREQNWNYQKSIANQDVKIGQQQEKLAQDRLRIVNQEKSIANLQTEQSEATIDYLVNQQFSSAALYEYMVEVLEKVYSYFLQEATAIAKLARNQLAFERQKNIPEFIKGDYWIPADANDYSSSQNQDAPDRKGITGSSRLLQDIYRLEQYADQTDQRKQQLTKTISLSNIAAFEFQQFKETGLMTFATAMNLFDRDYPGHYLRLIKSVSISVIALVPPLDGIKATFSSLGLSRVVTGGPLYQTQNIRRVPETISLSSPTNDTGVFELNQENKLLKPFEGSGVESFWEFRMEKAANPNVDYNAIADVLVTIEYEALNSFDYRALVVKQLNTDSEYEAMLPISFKSNLPDQWFDIVNPDQAETPFSVSFDLNKNNFPINVKDPVITNVLLYFPQEGEEDKEITIANFSFAESGSETDLGGSVTTNEARISTADANGNTLNAMLGKSVEGRWKLTLTDSPQLRQLIEDEKLTDILLVITFAGETPKYNI